MIIVFAPVSVLSLSSQFEMNKPLIIRQNIKTICIFRIVDSVVSVALIYIDSSIISDIISSKYINIIRLLGN